MTTRPKESRHEEEVLVELTKGKRHCLNKLISAGTASAHMLNRARILLKADVGEEDAGSRALLSYEIAEMLETSTVTVQRVRERFCTQGLDGALDLEALASKSVEVDIVSPVSHQTISCTLNLLSVRFLGTHRSFWQ